jgi:hypothetical protein
VACAESPAMKARTVKEQKAFFTWLFIFIVDFMVMKKVLS